MDALIPGGEPDGDGVRQVPVDQIERNPRQPRTVFNSHELEELAESIRLHGILQPLIVTPREDSTGAAAGRFVLIAGERRWLAAQQAGLDRVPVIVRAAGEQQRLELALIENVQRADLSPLETAEAYRQLIDDFNLAHEEIGRRVGKSRAAITNTLRLLKLSAAVQTALAAGQISEGHARALLGLPTEEAQDAALETVLARDLNVRATEELVRLLTGQQRPAKKPRSPKAPEILALEERLSDSLSTRVNLSRRGQGGTITIHYYSNEDLDNLVSRITGGDQEP
ncbi:MAG TPA: ParB/RepB/Spo0J family partition protein [Anaerolineales bacterium]|nr:ParB/RepB/Spo0J family partition protein [Anaerolineales bacterium]